LADGPHAEPPWLFLLGWYPSGFMMQHKDNEISVEWKRCQANTTFGGSRVAQRTQGTQNSLEGVSLKACSEHKMHWEGVSRKALRERKIHWKQGRAKHANCKTLFPQATLVAKGKVLIFARAQIQT
jgi:hypothetical protein